MATKTQGTQTMPIDFEEVKTKELVCKKCHKQFKTMPGFMNHKKKCGLVKCRICHNVCASQKALKCHLPACILKHSDELFKKSQHIIHNTQIVCCQTQSNPAAKYVIAYNYDDITDESSSDTDSDYDFDSDYNVTNINNFGYEDTSYISEEIIKKIIETNDILTFIKEKHFSIYHPENRNIRSIYKNDEYYKILHNKYWIIRKKDKIKSIIFQNAKTDMCKFASQYGIDISEQYDEEEIYNNLDKLIRAYAYILKMEISAAKRRH